MEENIVKSFIGKKSDAMYEKMQKKGSFNIFSMLFSSFYFMYRKMYLIGIVIFIIQYILTQLLENISTGIRFIILLM